MHVKHLAQGLTNHRGCNYFYSVISKDSSLYRRGVGDGCRGNISFHAPPISLSSWSPLTPVFLCFFPHSVPLTFPGTGACQQHPVVSFWICEPELGGQLMWTRHGWLDSAPAIRLFRTLQGTSPGSWRFPLQQLV